MNAPSRRLFSLDLLRGLDMFLLTVVGPLVVAADRSWHLPPAFMAQFDHNWGGFTLWDVIMPLFIFLAGVSIPFALAKRLPDSGDERNAGKYWRHVFARVTALWFGGLLVQGNLATLDVLKINYFNNTLQSIAMGYLIAAAAYRLPLRRVICPAAAFAMALLYGLLMHFLGDYSPHGNVAAVVEGKVLALLLPAESHVLEQFNDPSSHPYTWYLTSLMFGSMALCGVACGGFLKAGREGGTSMRLGALFAGGASLLATGLLLGMGERPVVPVIKHVYTVSFTAQAMGWCVLLLALLEAIPQKARASRLFAPFMLYGKCALVAYMASHFFGPAIKSAASTIAQGAPVLFGETCQPFVVAAVGAALLTFILVVRVRLRSAKQMGAAR